MSFPEHFVALDTEGIFRRTANAAILRQTQQRFNLGETVDFGALNDVTIPSVVLKTFLRELQEPILTFELYEPISKLYGKYHMSLIMRKLVNNKVTDYHMSLVLRKPVFGVSDLV